MADECLIDIFCLVMREIKKIASKKLLLPEALGPKMRASGFSSRSSAQMIYASRF